MEKIEIEMKVFTATYSEKHVLLIGDFYEHLMLETCSLILVTVISKKKQFLEFYVLTCLLFSIHRMAKINEDYFTRYKFYYLPDKQVVISVMNIYVYVNLTEVSSLENYQT